LSVKLVRLSKTSPKSCHPTSLETWGMFQVIVQSDNSIIIQGEKRQFFFEKTWFLNIQTLDPK